MRRLQFSFAAVIGVALVSPQGRLAAQATDAVAQVAAVVEATLRTKAAEHERPLTLMHEGLRVNGLRLEVAAKFVPEQDGWGSPKLETSFTFHNESNETIVLSSYAMYYRLVLSRVDPVDSVAVSQSQPKPFCGPAPEADHIIRILPGGKHVIKDWRWCESLSIPSGASVNGKLVDKEANQDFRLKRTGKLTLAFAYRSDGVNTANKQLMAFLKKGESLWSGCVYSNPVLVNVSHLRERKPVPDPDKGKENQ